ncbi:MAG TPA: ABC transporter substrate-binding protein [Candidatus Obscuribacterales bacterium]
MYKSTNKIKALLLGIIFSFGLFIPNASAETSAPAKGPIRIGYVVSLSGQSAEPGQKIVDGMNLYLEQIHHQMAGRKVQIVLENDESSPPKAVEKVRKLVDQDKVPVLSGLYLTNCLYAVAPVVENYQIPFVVVSSGAADVTQRQRKKWIVRTCYASTQLGFPLGDYAYKKMNLRSVSTIGADYGFGWEVVGAFQHTFEELGGKVMQKQWAPLGFKDFAPLIQQIRKDVEAVVMITVGQQVETIHKQYKELGPKLPVLGTTNTFDSYLFPKMGDEMTGGIGATLYSTVLDNPANKKFVRDYRAKYGEDPSYVAEHGYTAMMFMHKAIDSIHGDVEDKEKMLAALRKVELKDAPRGPVKIDAYGSSIDNVYITRVDRVKGKLQNTVVYTYPLVSQFFNYKPDEYMKQPPYGRDYPPCKYCSTK